MRQMANLRRVTVHVETYVGKPHTRTCLKACDYRECCIPLEFMARERHEAPHILAIFIVAPSQESEGCI